MIGIHCFLLLPAAVGVAFAGPCKPASSIITDAEETSTFTTAPETSAAESSTIFLSTSTTEDTTASTTLLTETTATIAADETNTEISSNTISTDAAESSLSTDITSLATTAETTTSESATTTTTAPAPDIACPSTRAQCFGSMNIKCGVFLVGITQNSLVDNLDECVRSCAADAGCYGFSYMASQKLCFTAPSANTILGQRQSSPWDSGVKGTC